MQVLLLENFGFVLAGSSAGRTACGFQHSSGFMKGFLILARGIGIGDNAGADGKTEPAFVHEIGPDQNIERHIAGEPDPAQSDPRYKVPRCAARAYR